MRYLDLVRADRAFGIWPFDEDSGTVAADYGSVGDATYSGSGITYGEYGPSGLIRRAVATDGVAGSITLPSLIPYLGSTQPQTWEVFLRYSADITSASALNIPWSSATATTGPMNTGIADTAQTNEVMTVYNFNQGSGDTTAWSGFTIPAGWHHHVVTYNGTQSDNWVYFLDGAAIGTRGLASGGAVGFVNTLTFRFARSSAAFYAVQGIAFAAVYNHRLSDAAIARHAAAGLGLSRVPSRTRLR